MTSSAPRPDLRAQQESARLPVNELVTRLREALGAKLVAYIASLHDTRTVDAWATGESVPTAGTESRLRVAYHVTSLLLDHADPQVVQVWFQGASEQLGDRAPARLLREDDLAHRESPVLAAARAFCS